MSPSIFADYCATESPAALFQKIGCLLSLFPQSGNDLSLLWLRDSTLETLTHEIQYSSVTISAGLQQQINERLSSPKKSS
mmetsp:Transcript_52312/g.106639  ORF Transcript_52312/g.106639 Transcript_52312/m.106639 type:complete len:80 (-) Transcript_52312:203-442(-)